ncbi:MAG: hypothetical protein JWM34_2394 [Ilumatobacteraceae bacterium]|nr:hypothetical protein [Ilumatobacteraceae bacterium]
MAGTSRGVTSLSIAVVLALTAVASVTTPAGAVARPADVAAAGTPSSFRPVGPVRLADTRETSCGCTRLDDHTIRVVIAGRDGIGNDIAAAAVTVTATAGPLAGYVTAYPSGRPRPDTSTVNLPVGADTSNSTIVPVGDGGAIDLYASVAADLVVDVSGTFTPTATAAAGRFVTVSPTRLLDTRATTSGGIASGGSVTIPLPPGVDADASALAVNVTSVDAQGPGYLTGSAAGSPPPPTSFLNPDGSGAAVAASVILPASANGITITLSTAGQVVVDLVGWFTGASAASTGDGLLVPVTPTRLLDTRTALPRLWPTGTRELASPVSGAAALVTNVTGVAADGPGYVTAYPAGTALPATSSLNAARRDATTPNLAITNVSTRGIAYYASAGTDLVVDITGYFTGAPVAATLPVPPNTQPVPRVLMIGDSTLGGFIDVPAATASFQGFVPVLDSKPCRRLIHTSCVSRFTHIAPNTALDAINGSQGPFDIVVIKTGYNDSAGDFATALAEIVGAARAKGAREIIWLTYAESLHPGSYDTSNATMKRLAGTAAYPDLVVADWRTYAANSSNWYASDRVHLMTTGVWATGDYISRWVAHVSHLPCAQPWSAGQPIDDPCPSPDAYAAAVGSTPNLHSLYQFR